jgi:hypothetical protein
MAWDDGLAAAAAPDLVRPLAGTDEDATFQAKQLKEFRRSHVYKVVQYWKVSSQG